MTAQKQNVMVLVELQVVGLQVAVRHVKTVNLILLHMVVSAVILLGMNLVLTVLILRLTIIGIVQDAVVQVMV